MKWLLLDCGYGSLGSPPAVQGIAKKLNGAHGLPDPKIGVQLEDSERSHFVTSFSSLQLLSGCV
jgi:hypothetical protein